MKLISPSALYILIAIFFAIAFLAEYLSLQPIVVYTALTIGVIFMLVRIFRGDD